jgi:hypothetical protein
MTGDVMSFQERQQMYPSMKTIIVTTMMITVLMVMSLA